MRTKWRGLRLACAFLSEVDQGAEPARYGVRRQALYDLNFKMNVKTVLDGCIAGHEQKYIDLVENWKGM